jgi:hypothetical protein
MGKNQKSTLWRRRMESPLTRVGKRLARRKLHLCNDEATLEIVGVVASTNDVSDAEVLPDLLQDVPGEIEQDSSRHGCQPARSIPKGFC